LDLLRRLANKDADLNVVERKTQLLRIGDVLDGKRLRVKQSIDYAHADGLDQLTQNINKN
jgi:hypothetical protein